MKKVIFVSLFLIFGCSEEKILSDLPQEEESLLDRSENKILIFNRNENEIVFESSDFKNITFLKLDDKYFSIEIRSGDSSFDTGKCDIYVDKLLLWESYGNPVVRNSVILSDFNFVADRDISDRLKAHKDIIIKDETGKEVDFSEEAFERDMKSLFGGE